jgi:AcrR family transcriptional regulator
MAGHRMTREARRADLLETAAAIVRSEGTDALTLARVAELAGVSKPIAYEHFQTRTGLLKALYGRIDGLQAEAVQAALATGVHSLDQAVSILAAAYIDCVLHIGMEYGAITAALSTGPEFGEILREGHERYARLVTAAIEPFAPLPADQGQTLMLGIIGAAEALAREATAGRLDRSQAINAITQILLGTVRQAGTHPGEAG